MLPSPRLFRSRWWALLWAAGICWTAIDVADDNSPPPPAGNGADGGAADGGGEDGGGGDVARAAAALNGVF